MNINNYENFCYGCGACKNICPNNAISIVINEEGFLKAKVDAINCIECGFCVKVCPILNVKYINDTEPECYAAWGKDNIRKVSSSGGVFAVIAEKVLEKKGCVVGARWDDDFYVSHKLIKKMEELPQLKGSKYVQSNILNSYQETEKELKKGNIVLFSGCPCQIAGLYSFLQYNYEKLITVDLICHGVSSTKVLKKYVIDNYGEKEIDRIDFRDKSAFGWSTEMNIFFKNGDIVRERAKKDTFFLAYLSNLSLNSVCENCQFTHIPRQGDISLGDFWEIEKYDRNLNDGKGTSLVLINNEKGKKVYSIISEMLVCNKKVPLQFVKDTVNKTVFSPFVQHSERKRFFDEINWKSFNKTVADCCNYHYDIGLVTTWFAQNYGAIFTAYALYIKLRKMGYSVLMIDKPQELWGDYYKKIGDKSLSLQFGKKYYNLSKQYSLFEQNNNIDILNDLCETFVVGSDQLWNPRIYGGIFYFFLDFVGRKHKKISYATSIGASKFQGKEEEKASIKYLLNKFDKISVREEEAVNICRDEFNIVAEKVLDPVFLLEEADYEVIIKDLKGETPQGYILAYVLDGNKEKKNVIEKVSVLLGIPLIYIVDIEHFEFVQRNLDVKATIVHTAEEWLWYIRNSSFVVTDSYHGACFSIIFQKDFICFSNKDRGEGRFQELFSLLGIEKQLLREINVLRENDLREKIQPINYDIIEKRLRHLKRNSENWLIKSMKESKRYELTDVDIFSEKVEKEIGNVLQSINSLEKSISNLKCYGDIHQLGLKNGCSVQSIVDSMPAMSSLQQVQGKICEPICDTPVPYGVLQIVKTSDYFVKITFTQMTIPQNGIQIYEGLYVNRKIIGWEKIVTESELQEMEKRIYLKLQEAFNSINLNS